MTVAQTFDSLDSYLQTFAGDMAHRAHASVPPLFEPGIDRLSEPVRRLTECAKVPYPAQAVAVEGLIRCYENDHKVAVMVGEMGTGKTCIGAWLIRALQDSMGRNLRVAITAPNQLVYKWRDHLQEILPGCRTIVVKSIKDFRRLKDDSQEVRKPGRPASATWARRWPAPSKTEIYIIARDKGKLGYAWCHGVNLTKRIKKVRIEEDYQVRWRKVTHMEFGCPKCGTALLNHEDNPLSHEDFITPQQKQRQTKHRCKKCGEELWQAYNGSPNRFRDQTMVTPGISPRRMAPCQYLRSIGARFDLYIPDEVHELKGEGTLQGQMFADMCNVSDRVLELTGTLTGGYAENLLHLMWRTIPHRLVADGLKHDTAGFEAFNKLYGVLREEKRFVGDNHHSMHDLMQGRGRASSTHTKVLPGISPVLFSNYLRDHCVFMRLADMHAHLPRFTEKVHTVRLTPEQDKAMAKMQKDFEDHRNAMRSMGQPCRAWSAARAAFLRWVDKPWIDEFTIFDRTKDGAKIPAFKVPSLAVTEYAKERRIRRLVKRNMLNGRKTWVYTELTGDEAVPTWDWMEYLAAYLEKHRIRCAILRTEASGGPKPEDREEWIREHAPNVDVVISNPNLVRTGLDLFEFPSIVFAYCGDNTYTLRQASRRAWRLGQKHNCEVDYIVYRGAASKSVQEAALTLMAQKMLASLSIEGDFSSEGLAAMSQSEDVSSQLAKFIDGTLDKLEPASTAFERYRKKLEESMPDLGKHVGQANVPIESIPMVPVEPPPTDADLVVADLGVRIEAIPTEDLSLSILTSLGVTLPASVTAPTEADVIFERPHVFNASSAEPDSLRDRKRLRLEALVSMMGSAPDESAGDLHRFGDRWVQLVAKRRITVRERNFEAAFAQHPDALIAFVEPSDEVGATTSDDRRTVEGIEYVVSMLTMAEYMAGERTTKPRLEVLVAQARV